MQLISNSLIHFLGRQFKEKPQKQFEIFEKIIQNGLKLSQMEIKIGKEQVNCKCVCFTDIPLTFCDEHVSIYGKFGIGFSKALIKNAGGNPARYFVNSYNVMDSGKTKRTFRGNLYMYLEELCRINTEIHQKMLSINGNLFDENNNKVIDSKDLSTLTQKVIDVLSFEKEMGDLGPAREENFCGDTFYKEREWRIIEINFEKFNQSFFIKKEDSVFMTFSRDDINFIIVPDDSMRIKVVDFIINLKGNKETRLSQFGNELPPVLVYDQLKSM